MPPEAEVEQFGFIGKDFAGSIFFDPRSGEFMGETLVSRSRRLVTPKPADDESGQRRARSA